MSLRGKNILFLGSSVTYGAASGGVSFVEFMAENCGITYVKEAVSGTTIADIDDTSYVSRLKKIDKTIKFDLFVCQLSTNDSNRGVPIEHTKQAIIFICNYIRETFGCPVVFYTNTYFDNKDYGESVKMLLELKKEYNFYVLDLWNDKEMQSVSKEDYSRYMKDCVHPALEGYREWWTDKFIDFCSEVLSATEY